MYNRKAVRGPQPKQGLEPYVDYKKKQSTKELCDGCHGRIDMTEKTLIEKNTSTNRLIVIV